MLSDDFLKTLANLISKIPKENRVCVAFEFEKVLKREENIPLNSGQWNLACGIQPGKTFVAKRGGGCYRIPVFCD